MKVYKTLDLGENCNISGINDGLPLKIARATTSKVLDDERLHYHKKGFEYYLVISGALQIRVKDASLEARTGDLVIVEPGESHKVERILQDNTDYLVINTNTDPLDKIVLE